MILGDLKIGDRFISQKYGAGNVISWDDVPESSQAGWRPDSWVWTKLDNYDGKLNYILGIDPGHIVVLRENEEKESNRIINSGAYCSCNYPNVVKNYALSNEFLFCRNCGKEKLKG